MGFKEDFMGNAPGACPFLHLVERSTSDVLEQAEALPFWSQDYTQLSKGAFSGSVTSVSCHGLQIFTETMNQAVDQIASAPVDSYVMGLPTLVDGESTWGLLPVTTNSLITLEKNAELYFKTSNISEITAAVIPAQRLETYAAEVEWIDLSKVMEGLKPVEMLHPDIAQQLLSALQGGMQYKADIADNIHAHQMWRNFEDDLLSTCLHTLLHVRGNIHPHFDQRLPRYLVNRVRDHTLSNSALPLTIGELCKSLRVSRRTLNHAFIRVLGITPVAYIRNLRLHRVRFELQQSPHEVISIAHLATKWGFWHLSLFSRYYRELFGECPIDTLQRARLESKRP